MMLRDRDAIISSDTLLQIIQLFFNSISLPVGQFTTKLLCTVGPIENRFDEIGYGPRCRVMNGSSI